MTSLYLRFHRKQGKLEVSHLYFPHPRPEPKGDRQQLLREKPLMKNELQVWPTTLAPLLEGGQRWDYGEGNVGRKESRV